MKAAQHFSLSQERLFVLRSFGATVAKTISRPAAAGLERCTTFCKAEIPALCPKMISKIARLPHAYCGRGGFFCCPRNNLIHKETLDKHLPGTGGNPADDDTSTS